MIPNFATNLREMTCIAGEDLNVTELLLGYPIPEVVVKKNGVEITEHHGLSLDWKKESVHFQLKNTCVDDSGEYSLIASNSVGSDTLRVLLNVIGKFFIISKF